MTDKIKQGWVNPTKIVIKENKLEERKTEAGLFLPPVGRNPQTSGKIVSTGTGTEKIKMELQVGMTVLYAPLSAQRFVLDDEEFALLDISSVMFAYFA